MTEERFPEEAAEENATSPSQEGVPDAAAAFFDLESLSPDEIALVLAHRRKTPAQAVEVHGTAVPEPEDAPATDTAAPPDERPALHALCDASEPSAMPGHARTSDGPLGEQPVMPAGVSLSVAPSGDARPEGMPQAAVTVPPVAPTTSATRVGGASPPKPPVWSPEALVALFEQKRGAPYDPASRACQLASASRLLAFRLPPAVTLPPDPPAFGRFYDACNDAWMREHHGEALLSYLIDPDKKSGQPHIVRLLARHATPAHAPGSRATLTPTPEQVAGLRPLIGVSGRPVFVPAGSPMKVLPPPPRTPRPGMVYAGTGV